MNVAGSTFTANTGGAISDVNATGGNVSGSRFYQNMAEDGGAIYTSSGGAEILSGNVFSENGASADGGAVYTADGSNGIFFSGGTITGNHAGGRGGGAYLQAISIVSTSIKGNSAADGGGIYSAIEGGVILEDSIVLGNEPNNCSGGHRLRECWPDRLRLPQGQMRRGRQQLQRERREDRDVGLQRQRRAELDSRG